MHFVHVEFQKVTRRVSKVGNCPVCGKVTKRATTIENTVNPYNKNAQGVPKSFEEVRADVIREAEDWEPDFRHRICMVETAV